MDHLHCQDCGAHFTNRAELRGHRCQEERHLQGQRGELPPDAAGGIQERPAGSESVDTTIATPNRRDRELERNQPGE